MVRFASSFSQFTALCPLIPPSRPRRMSSPERVLLTWLGMARYAYSSTSNTLLGHERTDV